MYKGMDTLLGDTTVLKLICLPSENGFIFLFFFFFFIKLLSRWSLYPGKQTGSHKSYLPFKEWREIIYLKISVCL